jgi:hypothetical protein
LRQIRHEFFTAWLSDKLVKGMAHDRGKGKAEEISELPIDNLDAAIDGYMKRNSVKTVYQFAESAL